MFECIAYIEQLQLPTEKAGAEFNKSSMFIVLIAKSCPATMLNFLLCEEKESILLNIHLNKGTKLMPVQYAHGAVKDVYMESVFKFKWRYLSN